MLNTPFPSWPSYTEEEVQAAATILRSNRVNYWTGQEARSFEKEYASYLGNKHAIALANGTVALELPLRLWGVGAGDDVIVTPRSFMASVGCVVLQNARPVFADVDFDSGNITAETIARALTPKTKAIILVHLGGWPCDLSPIMELAQAHGIKVLEDCAQAHGAYYRERPVGSIGHASAFSFCQDKIITTAGEGGLLATDDEVLWDHAWSFKDHGKTWEAVYERQHGLGFRWVHDRFGTNWRMTEIQAVIGRLQLQKLASWSELRTRNAETMIRELEMTPGLRVPKPPTHIRHAYYRLYAYLELKTLRAGWSRDRVVAEISSRGVPCFSGSCSEIYREKAFDSTSFRPAAPLATAWELGESSLAFLVHPTLNVDHLQKTVDATAAVMKMAVR